MTSTPPVRGRTACVGTWAGQILAVDERDGRVQWRTQVNDRGNPLGVLEGSPLVTRDRVYLGDGGGELHALDRTDGTAVWSQKLTGTARWRFPTTESAGASVWSSAAVDKRLGLIYIGVGQSYETPAGPLTDALIAVDYTTGQLVRATGLEPLEAGPTRGGRGNSGRTWP